MFERDLLAIRASGEDAGSGGPRTVAAPSQVRRLGRLARSFEEVVREFPGGQKFLDEQGELADLIDRQDPSKLEGRR